jgi:hypothetical protein
LKCGEQVWSSAFRLEGDKLKLELQTRAPAQAIDIGILRLGGLDLGL